MKKYKNTINYKNLIDSFILDKTVIKNTKDQIIINEHSYGLKIINANEDFPLMISGAALHKVFYGKHHNTINPDTIKNIAEHIKNDSVLGVEGFGTSKGHYAVFLVVKDKNNNPLLIGLSLNKIINRNGLQINEILTVFGKEEIQRYLDHAMELSSKIFMNKKSSLWLTANGLQLPNAGELNSTSYKKNIPSNNKKVKQSLNLKKYQDKANEHNKDLKKNVVSLEVKKDEEEI